MISKICITDDEGNVHEFDNFSDLIEYVDTCGQMSWLPDGYTWKLETLQEVGDDI